MKFETYPVTKADHEAADKQHAETRENSQSFLNEVANKIEAGEDLTSWERKWAAGSIRAFAETLPVDRKLPNSRPRIVPADAAVLVAIRVVHDGWTKIKAMEEQAARMEISEISTIEKAIKSQGYNEIKAAMLASRKK